jgi:hypothetical protein
VELMACLRQKLLWWWNNLQASYLDAYPTSLFAARWRFLKKLRAINWLLH